MADRRTGPGRVIGVVVAIAIIAAAVYLGREHLSIAARNPVSRDAILTANVVRIASTVSGRIVSFGVKENDAVTRGQVLFSIDPTPYRLVAEQTAADLAIAEAALADKLRTIQAEESNAQIAAAQVARANANLSLATQTLNRLEPLGPRGYVSAQQIDDAATAKRDAEISLDEALQQFEAAGALVGDTAAAVALVDARRAAHAIAEHELASTVIRAPNDGRVVGLSVSPGEFVVPGQAVFTLIDTENWFASAAFVETELSGIRVGSCATVYALAQRTVAIRGTVQGVGWGVVSEEQIDLPMALPLVPKSLDWVRIAQRFPVRVLLEDPPGDLMRMGASASVTIHDGDDC